MFWYVHVVLSQESRERLHWIGANRILRKSSQLELRRYVILLGMLFSHPSTSEFWHFKFCLWFFWQNSPTQFLLRQMARLQSMLPRYSVYTQVLVLYCIFSDASNLTFFVFESCWGHHCGDMIVATSLQQRRYGCIIAAASLLYQGVIAAALLLKHIGGIAQKISYSYHCFKCSESLQISNLISSMCKFHNTHW